MARARTHVTLTIPQWAVSWANVYCERFYEPEPALVKFILLASIVIT